MLTSNDELGARPLSDLLHIPKKKRALSNAAQDSSDDDDAFESPTTSNTMTSPPVSEDEKARKKAMKQLRALADKYKLEASASDGWTAQVCRQVSVKKKKASAGSTPEQASTKSTTTLSVQYIDPSGRRYQSVFEAVNAIRQQSGAGKVCIGA